MVPTVRFAPHLLCFLAFVSVLGAGAARLRAAAAAPAPQPGALGPAPNFVGNTTTLDTKACNSIGRRTFAAGGP